MIHIDLQSAAVTVEGNGDLDHLITVRTLQTAGSSSQIARYPDANAETPTDRLGRDILIEETIRSRQGANVLREYDVTEPGVYSFTSGRRELQQNRTFFLVIEFLNNEEMQITVRPGSATAQWIVNDELHNYVHGDTFKFSIRVTAHGMATGDGEVTRIESGKGGVKFARTTAWERLMDDDETDSV